MEGIEERIIREQMKYNKNEVFLINLFWISIGIYSLAFAAIKGLPAYAERLQLVQFVCVLFFIPASLALIRFKIAHQYLKFFYIIYFIWSAYIVFKGISLTYLGIKSTVIDPDFGVLIYYVPIVVLFPKNISYLKNLFKVIIILSIFFVLYCLYFRASLFAIEDNTLLTGQGLIEVFSRSLELACGFILLTQTYHQPKRKYLTLLIIIFALLIAVIRARRGLVFFQSSYLLIGVLLFFLEKKKKITIIASSLLIIGLLSFFWLNLYKSKEPSIFKGISERIGEDTRSGVEECFFEDMRTQDWIIGKGLNGEYLCPGIDNGIFNDYRSVIETGYLNIVLKEGLVGLGLLLLLLIPASIKGIFFSKNLLSKAAGFWILLWVIDLYPATLKNFNLNYLLVWIAVGICYSPEIRNMAEEKVKEMLSFKNNTPQLF